MHKRRHGYSGGSPPINLGLIITPMLDMSFQILAFFIMTYHPSALEGHIPGSLVPPENFAKKGKENAPANPSDPPLSVPEEDLNPELNEAIQVKIKSVAKGQEFGNRLEGYPSQLFIKQGTDTAHQMIADVDVDFDKAMKILDTKLKDLINKGSTKKTNLKIEADNDLRQQFVMMVYDTCKKAGFDKIHFVPPPILNAKLK
jgi:biopolymer transport protein ExbD